MSEVISVVSGKGGTGNTTVCAGIAAALANFGLSVVILEVNYGFGCLDSLFGMEGEIKFDISDHISEKCRLKDCINKVHGAPGLSIICAPNGFSHELDPKAMTESIMRLKKVYDFVFIDTGALDKNVMELLPCSDRIFFIVNPDSLSMRNIPCLSEKLHELGCENQRLIINKLQKKYFNNSTRKNADDIINACGIQLIGIVPEDTRLSSFCGNKKAFAEGIHGYAPFSEIAERICKNN